MNVILEKTAGIRYYTCMSSMYSDLGITAATFDWYVSDIETNYHGAAFQSEDHWISGEELEKFLAHNEVQFIWGVFSAVPKGFRSTVNEAPYADGNPDYWKGMEITPQLPGALFEIACWDGSATIFIGLPPDALNSLRRIYPDIRPLAIRS